MLIKQYLDVFLRSNGRAHFLSMLPANVSIFDVGCGNNSPYKTKQILPNCVYYGIDIGDHNQTKPNLADEYIVTSSERFTSEIAQFVNKFDVVISSHNLEHCDDRFGTLMAMIKCLKVGGQIFLSFPSEKSIKFPNRTGTLNYYDDPTHKYSPPDFENILKLLSENHCEVIYSCQSYKPTLLAAVGLLLEPLSHFCNKKFPGSWEYWGFESIIIAKKLANFQQESP
jgi:SAM-dependent methyltransferase